MFQEWHKKALCAEIEGDLWFPEAGGMSKEHALAIEICSRCPVKEDCLAEALANNIQYGVWGGLSPVERNSLRKKLRK